MVDGFDGRLPYRNVDAITNTTPKTKYLTEKEKQEACMEEVARMTTLGNFPHKEAQGTDLHGRSQVLQDKVREESGENYGCRASKSLQDVVRILYDSSNNQTTHGLNRRIEHQQHDHGINPTMYTRPSAVGQMLLCILHYDMEMAVHNKLLQFEFHTAETR